MHYVLRTPYGDPLSVYGVWKLKYSDFRIRSLSWIPRPSPIGYPTTLRDRTIEVRSTEVSIHSTLYYVHLSTP